MTRRLNVFVGVGLALSACKPPETPSKPPTTPAPSEEPTPRLTIRVRAEADANNGYPVHMMVRAIGADALSTESYDAAADVLFASPPDPSVLDKAVVLPSTSTQRIIDTAGANELGVYFFVAADNPTNWKIVVPDSDARRLCLCLSGSQVAPEECSPDHD